MDNYLADRILKIKLDKQFEKDRSTFKMYKVAVEDKYVNIQLAKTIEKISQIISIKNDVTCVLICHLELEKYVNRLLDAYFMNQAKINLYSLNFSTKLNLIKAMDLYPNDVLNVIQKISKLRNDFAHVNEDGNSKTLIEDNDIKIIENTFQGKTRNNFLDALDLFLNHVDDKSNRTKLIFTVSFIVCLLSVKQHRIIIDDYEERQLKVSDEGKKIEFSFSDETETRASSIYLK